MDEGRTADDLYEIVRRNNPEMFEDEISLKKGRLVRWLISYVGKNKVGYGARRQLALKIHQVRKANKNARRAAQEEGSRSNEEEANPHDGENEPEQQTGEVGGLVENMECV